MSVASRTDVINIHTDLGIPPPSHHTVMHMASAMDEGTLTDDLLRASLVQSDAYRSSVRTRFRDACYTLLGEDDDAGFRAFVNVNAHAQAQAQVSDDEIETAVRHGARFESRYVELIRRNYVTLMSGEQPSESFVSGMASRFRVDPFFRLEHLQATIRELLLPLPSKEETPVPPPSPLTPTPTQILTPTQTQTHPQTREPDRTRQLQVLLIGDLEYGRPWYALESIAYLSECLEIQDTQQSTTILQGHIKTLLCDHTEAWERARAVHFRLLGDTLDEVDFVRRYVGRHRVPGFDDLLSSEILATPLYEQRIRAKLCTVQMSLYDVALTDDELTMLFGHARITGVGVSDDEVSKVLHSHRRECDELASQVVGVYVAVLSREPDGSELATDVKRFRDTGATTAAGRLDESRVELSIRLSRGYEFHDVVKTRLRSAYQTCGGAHVPMQLLYSMLERVLQATETTLRAHDGAQGLTSLVDCEISRCRPSVANNKN